MTTSVIAQFPLPLIRKEIRKEITRMIREIIADPDAGLELTPYAVRRLEKTLEEKRQGKTRSLYAVLKKYGME